MIFGGLETALSWRCIEGVKWKDGSGNVIKIMKSSGIADRPDISLGRRQKCGIDFNGST
jgi:hypothetical protein